jgi:cytochrome c oxidase cbb3-type subunit 3
LCGLLLLSSWGCDRPPSASSLEQWTPADHHSVDDGRQSGQQPIGGQGQAQGRGSGSNVAELVDLTWRQQCANCHGISGRGDGQMGPMVKAPDLTDRAWQTSVSDADIASRIKGGKNKMPKFDLPDAVITGLVAHVRSLRGP